MDNSAQITKEQKDKLYNELYDALLAGLEVNSISHDDSQVSAEFILSSLEKTHDYNSLMFFLQDLSNRWPVYKDVYTRYKKNDNEKEDSEALAKTRNQLNSL